jgi:hypothetical protein
MYRHSPVAAVSQNLNTVVARKGKAFLPTLFVQDFYKKKIGKLSAFR